MRPFQTAWTTASLTTCLIRTGGVADCLGDGLIERYVEVPHFAEVVLEELAAAALGWAVDAHWRSTAWPHERGIECVLLIVWSGKCDRAL